MSYAQLTRDEVRILRRVGAGSICPASATPHETTTLRTLASANLIATTDDAIQLTPSGRDWLTVYGMK